MNQEVTIPFITHFKDLKDPRIERKKLYPLSEIIFVILCGVICFAESWRDLVTFAEERLPFLRQFLPFSNGIPSKNTYSRVMAALDPSVFKGCFINWVQSFQEQHELIAIDGKTLRHSYDKAKNKPAIHMVSAFASEARLVLGQYKVDDKSNEITAIPALLEQICIQGSTISIDAMGCQKAIADKIIQKEGDYVFSLKGNHSKLHDDVRLFLDSEIAKNKLPSHIDYYEEADKGHGRLEQRKYWVTNDIQWLDNKDNWSGLCSIGVVESHRDIKGKTSIERRYFIGSIKAEAKFFAKVVRNHWSIENNLHWTLDMVFNEDQSRIREKNAAENMSIIRHCVINMLQKAKGSFKKDISLKGLRKKAAWGQETLRIILMQKF